MNDLKKLFSGVVKLQTKCPTGEWIDEIPLADHEGAAWPVSDWPMGAYYVCMLFGNGRRIPVPILAFPGLRYIVWFWIPSFWEARKISREYYLPAVKDMEA